MPYANNQGIRIYYEVEGEGPPLVLMHGRAGSGEDWRALGYVEALQDDYRLVLIDARGHGRSDKPHDPKVYRKALRAADVVAVLDDLRIDKAHFMGYSVGDTVGFSIAKYAPERLISLIVGGRAPFEADEPDGPNPHKDSIQVLRQGMNAFLAAWEGALGSRWRPELKARLQGNDLEALLAQCTLRERVGLLHALSDLMVPCPLYSGENDGDVSGAKTASEIIPNATFVS